MRTRRYLAGLSFVTALLLAACEGDDPIHIGLAGPVSRPAGRSMNLAAQMAVEEINAAGGVRGRPLALTIADDEENPERAIEGAMKLSDDRTVVAVVGHLNSAATLAAAEVYNEAGLVAVSPASSSPRITEAGDWTFRVCPSDLQHGPALARWIRSELNKRRVTVLYANEEYGRGVLGAFASAFEQEGGTILSRDPYLTEIIETETVIDPYIERAMRGNMEALVIAGMADGAIKVIRAARRLGFTGPIVGADGLSGVEAAGAVAEGVYFSAAFLADRGTTAAREFVRNYEQRFNERPDAWGAMTYDAIRLLARAIDEVGTDRAAIRDYLAGVGTKYPAFEGVTGTIAFDENGDVVDRDVAIGVVRRGRVVSAGS